MTPEIALILSILTVSVVLLVTEWIPMEVTALLALGAVALTGLVRPVEALSGFSSPAVVTVWAVFIISGGLTRTGVANIIGKMVLKMAGRREALMVAVVMITAGVMSAVMNNVAVAALMLPVVMDVARQTETPPSRLLMPLAYGCLLGGLATQIGTPPNILVTEALREAGLPTFSFFDFTPVGLVVMAAGVAFMVLGGRFLLPDRNPVRESSERGGGEWKSAYGLNERLFHIRIPRGSPLVEKTLSESRIGSALEVTVLGITREDRTLIAPDPSERLAAGDLLVAEGPAHGIQSLQSWRLLDLAENRAGIGDIFKDPIQAAEVQVADGSPLEGKTLNALGFRERYQVSVLGVSRDGRVHRTRLPNFALRSGDHLLVAGQERFLQQLAKFPELERVRRVSGDAVVERWSLDERLVAMMVPEESSLVGRTLRQTRLGGALGLRVLGIRRKEDPIVLPEPQEVLRSGDLLIMEASPEDFEILHGLEQLEVQQGSQPRMESLLTDRYGLVEAILSPHTTLAGRTLRQLNFREKYGLNVLAVWREGSPIHDGLGDLPLRFGDALLLFGADEKIRMLGAEPDFIVLTGTAQERPRSEKAKVSVSILAAVLFPVVAGWVPIYIAAVVGAALMVLFRCLTMEEAYRQIEWKAVFLIAGMLPLGTALDQTGAARLIAEAVVGVVGPLGPRAVMAGLIALTFAATCFIPTAALVVLMAPIVLRTSMDMGISPHALMMAVAMAASASFTTPIAHPANILVMGPGGYRFLDYLKVGGILTVVIFVVLSVVVPLFWPLRP